MKEMRVYKRIVAVICGIALILSACVITTYAASANAPVLQSVTTADGGSTDSVPADGVVLTLHFNHNVIDESIQAVNRAAIHVYDSSGVEISKTVIFPDNFDDRRLIYLQLEGLQGESDYTIYIDGSFMAKNGSTMEDATSVTFRTGILTSDDSGDEDVDIPGDGEDTGDGDDSGGGDDPGDGEDTGDTDDQGNGDNPGDGEDPEDGEDTGDTDDSGNGDNSGDGDDSGSGDNSQNSNNGDNPSNQNSSSSGNSNSGSLEPSGNGNSGGNNGSSNQSNQNTTVSNNNRNSTSTQSSRNNQSRSNQTTNNNSSSQRNENVIPEAEISADDIEDISEEQEESAEDIQEAEEQEDIEEDLQESEDQLEDEDENLEDERSFVPVFIVIGLIAAYIISLVIPNLKKKK